MNEISINEFDLSTMCRLCLSKNGTMLNIFAFSARFMEQVADVIMKCAPVKITSCTEMPNSICQTCYTQLEKSHQFQEQIVQSDKTLRHYLEQVRTSNRQIKTECSDDSLIHNTNTDIAIKCEYSEFQDISDINVNIKEEVPSNYTSADTINEEISLKFKIKVEPTDNKSVISTDYLMNTLSIGCDSKTSYYKEEPIDDKSLVPTECNDYLIDSLSEGGGGIEIKFKNSEIKQQSENITWLPPADITENFDNSENENKIISERRKNQKKSNEREYKCDLCNKQFTALSQLNTHKRKHTGERPFQCDVCNKSFVESGILLKHKRVHTGENPHQCDVCNKIFSSLQNLIRHERIHTGEKPFQCDLCTKSFSQLVLLKKHQRVHTGEKPYQCDVCNKSFSSSYDLIRHKRVHTGEKPYQCDVCNKQFSQSSSLKTHKRKHSSVV